MTLTQFRILTAIAVFFVTAAAAGAPPDKKTRASDSASRLRAALAAEPDAAMAPSWHLDLLASLKGTAAIDEAEKSAALYGPGTAWRERHGGDPLVVARADEFEERALYSVAYFRHQRALELKAAGKYEEAKAAFNQARAAHRKYLARFRQSKHANAMNFYLAECLFNTFAFDEAAAAYERVREADDGSEHRVDAAYSAVVARQKLLEAARQAGEAFEPRLIRASDRADEWTPLAVDLIPVELEWVRAIDALLVLVPAHERAADLAYKAAELYYARNHYPEARRRFQQVVDRYPATESAGYAVNLLMDTYLATRDWDGIVRIADENVGNTVLFQPGSQLREEFLKFKWAAVFKQAELAQAEGRFEDAARMFLSVANAGTVAAFRDIALNNAAVNYGSAEKHALSLTQYERLIRDYPQSPLVPSAREAIATIRRSRPAAASAAATPPSHTVAERRAPFQWPDLSTDAATARMGDKDAALIVAIERYDSLPAIPGALSNAADWYRFLTRSRGIAASRVRLLRDADATLELIQESADEVAARTRPGGTLWFIFIGHGAPAPDGKDGVLVGSDARQSARSLYGRSVRQTALLERLSKGKHARTVAVLDACFSGRAADGAALVAGLQPAIALVSKPSAKTALVLAAGKGNEFAGPLPGANRPAFSYLLLGALRGWGDADRDGKVTAREAIDFADGALRTIVTNRLQTPQLVGAGGETALATGVSEAGPELADYVLGQ